MIAPSNISGMDEGGPGPKGGDASPLHFAYFRDPGGNKLCCHHVVPPDKC